MPSVYDLYPEKWLSAKHLQNKRPLVTIQTVELLSLFNPRSRKEEPRIVISFFGKERKLPLNKTQTLTLMEITGTDEYPLWHGYQVVLSVGRAPNGTDTITISPVPDKSE